MYICSQLTCLAFTGHLIRAPRMLYVNSVAPKVERHFGSEPWSSDLVF